MCLVCLKDKASVTTVQRAQRSGREEMRLERETRATYWWTLEAMWILM